MSYKKLLETIYLNASRPGSLGGVAPLLREARKQAPDIKRGDVIEFLKTSRPYTLHKPYYKKYVRRPIVVGSIDKQWQADLADMNSIKSDNSGARYILTVIDCFSKFAWAVPIQNKSGQSVCEGFNKIFKLSLPRKPQRIQTDKGKEFFNTEVGALFKKYHIFHFASNSDQKAAIVERFNRTLKTKIWHYFTAKNTNKYVDILPDILKSYNTSHHRTIGMAPKDVKKSDELAIWQRMYKPALNSGTTTLTNEPVRISKAKHIFEKGYLPNWTEESFNIDSMDTTRGPTIYKLKDKLDEPIAGVFYKSEIQPIVEDTQQYYNIERIVGRKKVSGAEYKLIKWQGYPNKFNSWVKAADILDKQ